MTVINRGTEDEELEDFTPIIKLDEAHNRSIVKMFFLATYKHYCLVTVSHDSVKAWNVVDGEDTSSFVCLAEASKWRCGVQSADMRSSGYSGNITEIDITGHSRAEITRKESFAKVNQICCMAYSNINRVFAVASNEGLVTLFDHDTLKMKYPIEVHSVRIRAMLFTLDDEYLLTGADDKTIRLSQIGVDKTSSLVRQYCGHNSAVLSLSLDPTSGGARFASCSVSSQIFIWDINQPLATHTVQNPHEGIINCILFSHNGHHLFSAGEDKRLICYRIPQIGEPILTLGEPQFAEDEDNMNGKENLFDGSPYGDGMERSVTPTYDNPNSDLINNEEDLDDV